MITETCGDSTLGRHFFANSLCDSKMYFSNPFSRMTPTALAKAYIILDFGSFGSYFRSAIKSSGFARRGRICLPMAAANLFLKRKSPIAAAMTTIGIAMVSALIEGSLVSRRAAECRWID